MFNNIRQAVHISLGRKIVNTVLIILFAVSIGAFVKFIETIPSNHLPYFIEKLDIGNFFSRIAVWYFLAVVIAVYSKTPIRAAINVFCFFAGMLLGYYAWTRLFAGFYPDKSYFMLWIRLTALSPVLAAVCWYAKGRGKMASVISAVIISVLFFHAFSFGLTYFSVSHVSELFVWLAGIALLHKTLKQTIIIIVLSLIFAVIIRTVFPFGFYI